MKKVRIADRYENIDFNRLERLDDRFTPRVAFNMKKHLAYLKRVLMGMKSPGDLILDGLESAVRKEVAFEIQTAKKVENPFRESMSEIVKQKYQKGSVTPRPALFSLSLILYTVGLL